MSENIIGTAEGKILDGERETLDTLMREMVESVQKEEGTLNYELTIAEDDMTLHVYERYKDAEAAIAHLPTWGSLSKRFTAAVDFTRFVLFCSLPPDLKEAVAGLNPTYMTPIGGFAKWTQLPQ